MATAPQYAATPIIGSGFVFTANPSRDGSGAVVVIAAGAANGTRIDRLVVQAITATAAGMIRIYVAPPALDGRLIMEITVDAITPSSTVPGFRREVSLSGGLMLPPNYTLLASTAGASTFWVSAFGANF